jgi:hypothetical protein
VYVEYVCRCRQIVMRMNRPFEVRFIGITERFIGWSVT